MQHVSYTCDICKEPTDRPFQGAGESLMIPADKLGIEVKDGDSTVHISVHMGFEVRSIYCAGAVIHLNTGSPDNNPRRPIHTCKKCSLKLCRYMISYLENQKP